MLINPDLTAHLTFTDKCEIYSTFSVLIDILCFPFGLMSYESA